MTGFLEFLSDDAGAVTIDWVTLTSAVLLVGIMVIYAIYGNGVAAVVDLIDTTLTGIPIDIDVGDAPGCDNLGSC